MKLKLGIGLNYAKGFGGILKSLIMVNIKMAKKLVNGIFCIVIGKLMDKDKCKIQYKVKSFSGGGLYDKGGNGNKNGKWIELSDGFMQFS